MQDRVLLCVLNAKYVHASPAPWCLAAGVRSYAPQLADCLHILEGTINQPLEELLERIVPMKPAVVGFSCYLWNIVRTLELCAFLKEALPHVTIVLGGPEVSYCAKEVLERNGQVDYILAGEGEESFPAFLQRFFAKEPLLPDNIGGLCGRFSDGSVFTSDGCVLQGEIPSPLTAGYAEAIGQRIAYFETSRGCPYSCAFCLSGGCGRPRFFSLDTALPDLVRLANSGVRTVKFVDRTFNANPAHANRILRFILEQYGSGIPQGVCFHFEIAGDILREETFLLLSQMPAGAVQLEIGMQSFCRQTLEAVLRKTDTQVLQQTIRRLVAMGNMHIHIDLIAGLPLETLELFAQSFDTGYALGAQMLQLGFLKLLHGSRMRSNPQEYPCDFDTHPPYEVRSTPWLSQEELSLLHHTEDAVERVYNSGRFRRTAEYVMAASGQTPFTFYTALGVAAAQAGLAHSVPLDEYTAFLQRYCAALPNVDAELLRDMLVRDRLSTNSTGRLPHCLYRPDALLATAVRRLAEHPDTAPQQGVKRAVAFLYGARSVCWVDYPSNARHPVTGRWPLCECSWESMGI